jgi:hypothetical protein
MEGNNMRTEKDIGEGKVVRKKRRNWWKNEK